MRVQRVPWEDSDGEGLRTAQRAELSERYHDPNSEPGVAPSARDITIFYVAYSDDGAPIACGGLRQLDADHGEIKRMYVAPDSRGSGASRLVLATLEDDARSRGWTRLVLETGVLQPDAIRFYEREGYTPIPKFGHYVDSDISLCFAKRL
jgi:GNAT superfamily N-acetyltransferase